MNAETIINGTIAVICIASFGYCQYDHTRTYNKNYDACLKRGVEYFSSTDSWPTLRDGRSATSVIDERCKRTPTAF